MKKDKNSDCLSVINNYNFCYRHTDKHLWIRTLEADKTVGLNLVQQVCCQSSGGQNVK